MPSENGGGAELKAKYEGEIRAEAFDHWLWRLESQEPGSAWEDWLQAEHKVLARHQSAGAAGAAPIAINSETVTKR